MTTRSAVLEFVLASALAWGALASSSHAQTGDSFHFPPPADLSQADAAPDSASAEASVDDACRHRLKSRKVLFLVAEQQGDQWMTSQDRYQPLLQVIDKRLRALGFKLYTPAEIKAGIAQAEIDAYFKNDPDSALAASRKLGANYILRGTITSQTGINPVVQVNEVAINIDMTLSALDGHPLSDVSARADSYSGSDTLHTAVTLVNEQADRLVAQLANDYCRQNGIQH